MRARRKYLLEPLCARLPHVLDACDPKYQYALPRRLCGILGTFSTIPRLWSVPFRPFGKCFSVFDWLT